MIAVLSDIHGNLEALNAVLGDIKKNHFKINHWILLGDYVDYGADSREVVNRLYDLQGEGIVSSICGNHDFAVYTGDCSAFRTGHGRKNFQITCKDVEDEETRQMISELCRYLDLDVEFGQRQVKLVHATLENRLWGKSEPLEFVPLTESLQFSLEDSSVPSLVLQGHSHIQGFRTDLNTCFINPGSVGQPRNGDSRAQYLVCDDEGYEFIFRRVEYDIKTTARKIVESGRPSFLATRLFLGI